VNVPARILLAEDDRILRKAGEVTLRKKGYEVMVAVDGQDALTKIREHTPDLILLDVMMPKLDGFEVLMHLKADPDTRSIPVIVLSNLDEGGNARKAADCGAQAYLVKSSLRPEQLAEIVAETLARRG
jgi:two-component system alkaline phosphatase synthesis response regulator PhoP